MKNFIILFTSFIIIITGCTTSTIPTTSTNIKSTDNTKLSFTSKSSALKGSLNFMNGVPEGKKSFSVSDLNASYGINFSYIRNSSGEAIGLEPNATLLLHLTRNVTPLNVNFQAPEGSVKLESSKNGTYKYKIEYKGFAMREWLSGSCISYDMLYLNTPTYRRIISISGTVTVSKGKAVINVNISSISPGQIFRIACSPPITPGTYLTGSTVKGNFSWEQNVEFPVDSDINVDASPSLIGTESGNITSKISVKPGNTSKEWKMKIKDNADYSLEYTNTGNQEINWPDAHVNTLEDGTYNIEVHYIDEPEKSSTTTIEVKNKFDLLKDKSEINNTNSSIKFDTVASNPRKWKFSIEGTTTDTIDQNNQINPGSKCTLLVTGNGSKALNFNGICENDGKYFKNGSYTALLESKNISKYQGFSVNMPENEGKCKANEVYMPITKRCCPAGATCSDGSPPVLVTPKPPTPTETPIDIYTPTPSPMPTIDPSSSPSAAPTPTPHPTLSPTPSVSPTPNVSPTPSVSIEPFGIYSTVVSSEDSDDLSYEIAMAEKSSDNLIAKGQGFKIAAANTPVTPVIRINHNAGQGKNQRLGSTIVLWNRTPTTAKVIGNISIVNSNNILIATYPEFQGTMAINQADFIPRVVNNGQNIIKVPMFKGIYRPGVDGTARYFWYGRNGTAAGPNIVPGGDYDVKTTYRTVYIGTEKPFAPSENLRSIIAVKNDFPNYTNHLPKTIPDENKEHLRAGHRYDYLTQLQYDNLIGLYNSFSTQLHMIGPSVVSEAVSGLYGKDGCFNSGWNDNTVLHMVEDVANMRNGSDRWTSNGNLSGMRIFGTRGSNGYTHNIVVVVDRDNEEGEITTGYPENNMDAIKKKQVMQGYAALLKTEAGRSTLSTYLLNK